MYFDQRFLKPKAVKRHEFDQQTIASTTDTATQDDKSDSNFPVYVTLGCSSLLLVSCLIFALFWVFRKKLLSKRKMPVQQIKPPSAATDDEMQDLKKSAKIMDPTMDSTKGTDSKPKAKTVGVSYEEYYKLFEIMREKQEKAAAMPHYIDIDPIATAENLKKTVPSSYGVPKTKMVYTQEKATKSIESVKFKSFELVKGRKSSKTKVSKSSSKTKTKASESK